MLPGRIAFVLGALVAGASVVVVVLIATGTLRVSRKRTATAAVNVHPTTPPPPSPPASPPPSVTAQQARQTDAKPASAVSPMQRSKSDNHKETEAPSVATVTAPLLFAPPPQHRPPSVAVVSGHVPTTAVAERTRRNHHAYCAKHNYEYFHYDCAPPELLPDEDAEPAHFSQVYFLKIWAVLETMQRTTADYILWIDADAVFDNQSLRIEEVLPALTTGAGGDLHVAADPPQWSFPLSSGVFVLRNGSPNTRRFLEAVWAARNDPKYRRWPLESRAMYDFHTLIATKFYDSARFNAHPSSNYTPGDFVLHMAGMTDDQRLALLDLLVAAERGED